MSYSVSWDGGRRCLRDLCWEVAVVLLVVGLISLHLGSCFVVNYNNLQLRANLTWPVLRKIKCRFKRVIIIGLTN